MAQCSKLIVSLFQEIMGAPHIRKALDIESGPSFQELFQEVDSTYFLTEEAEQILSKIVHASLEAIITGACKLADHRNADNLGLHDVVLFLKTQFNMDPLSVTDGYYYVTETCDEVEPPRPVKKSKQRKLKLPKSPKSAKTAEGSEPTSKPKRQSKIKK